MSLIDIACFNALWLSMADFLKDHGWQPTGEIKTYNADTKAELWRHRDVLDACYIYLHDNGEVLFYLTHEKPPRNLGCSPFSVYKGFFHQSEAKALRAIRRKLSA